MTNEANLTNPDLTAFLPDLGEILTGTGAHAEHDRRQVGRCVYCSCGKRVQGRMTGPGEEPADA